MIKVKKNLHDLEEGFFLTGLQKTLTTKPTITMTITITITEKTHYAAQHYITPFFIAALGLAY